MYVFKKIGILSAVLILLSLSCRTPGSTRRTNFSYSSNIGVAVVRSGRACLELHNQSVPTGSKVSLVAPTVPQSTSDAEVIGRAEDTCPTIDAGDPNLHRYEIRTAKGSTLSSVVYIAILGSKGSFTRVDNLVAVDLDQDGRQEFFRSCTSAEGIHFTVWSGRPLESTRLWHEYYYLGYDVKSDCTQLDFESR